MLDKFVSLFSLPHGLLCWMSVLVTIPVAGTFAQNGGGMSIEARSYQTSRTEIAPVTDGHIDEPAWDAVPWAGGFTQRQPYDGSAPTQETEFKILFDDKNLYIAIRCFDDNPDEIVSRMARRDGFPGDLVEVNIDSYNDKRTAFSFSGSVSGVKGDEFVTNDGTSWDASWNPVWLMKTAVDSLGWTCEMEIPLTQLRYDKDPAQVWGLQVMRHDFRKQSRSVWQYIPLNSGFWVSGFGALEGLDGLKAKRQIEIQPYVLGQLETFNTSEGNPFSDGSDWSGSIGLDGKIGITSDLTFDFTVNPDFGQVEADPSVVRLDGFQIFYDERRPFFIENRNLFNYNISQAEAGGSFNIDNLFYSRRIGAQPHRFIAGDESENIYVDQPNFTSILGAGKISGKTKKGLSVGILNAVTAKEVARIDQNGERSEEVIEPLTNYFTARITQDLNEGNTVIGGIFTSTNRRLSDPALEFLHKSALSAGGDVLHRWKDRAWQANGRFVFSRVAGSTEAISRTQLAIEHYFQRPDADYLTYDSTRTELWGHGGDVSVGNYRGEFQFQTGVTWRSPGLELNDIGFLRNADEINHYFWMSFRENDPFGPFLSLGVNYSHSLRWDFGGRNLYQGFNVNGWLTFKNQWRFSAGMNVEGLDVSNNWLRGGPAYNRPNGFFSSYELSTDQRRVVSFSIGGNAGGAKQKAVEGYGLTGGIRVQPSDALNFTVTPSYNSFKRFDQYVTTKNFGGDPRYILSGLKQQTLSFTFRLNFNITPDLTIQYYGQPFISRGVYNDFNYVVDPLNRDVYQRLEWYTEDQISRQDDQYLIDEDLNGTTDYSFGLPDFNFVQFRSNLVLRWEYIPGSELFLIWNQGNTNPSPPDGGSIWDSLWEDAFTDQMHNTFLVKLTYRFVNR